MRSPANSPKDREPRPVRMTERPALGSLPSTSARALPPGCQLLAISARSSTRRSVVTLRNVARRSQLSVGAVLGREVGEGAVAGAGAGAVEVLAPEQELDGMPAGGDVGVRPHRRVELVAQEIGRDLRGVDRLLAEAQRRRADQVGGKEGVVVRGLAIGSLVDIVDETLVEGPGVHVAFPVVDDGIAEAIGLGMHVPGASVDPSLARRIERGLGGRGDERGDRFLQPEARGVGVAIGGGRDVRIGGDDRFGGDFSKGRDRGRG